jgi:hypothetical protein
VSEERAAPVALTFLDAGRGLHGTIRSGLTLLFEGREARAERAAAEIERSGDGWRAQVGGEVDLTFTPQTDTVDLAGFDICVCEVQGRFGAVAFSGLGTIAETRKAPEWADLDALRALSAVFSPELAALAVARRSRDAQGHGDELVSAALLEAGEVRIPEDARISTVYDGSGRQHSSGLELWFPGEDYPRRLFGTVQAGTSLELDGLFVHAAAFNWRMEGNTGAGLYELTMRRGGDDEPAAA